MGSHFVNPFTDIGFKIIFGQPASKDLLITLLNELLAGEHQIENLIFLDKENRSDNMDDAGIIYDLYCLTTTGEYIIVEMQNRMHSNFLDRTLFYMCRAIGRQVENIREKKQKERELCQTESDLEEDNDFLGEPKPDSYGSRYKLSTVYGVFLMNFSEPGLEDKFRTDTVIADRESGKVVNAHFRQIYLQFPFFKKELNECETLYDKLIYTLKNMQHWNRMPDALKEQVFSRLEELAAVANLSLEDRIAYDKALDRYRVSRIVEEDAREAGWKKGLAEGRAEGHAEGKVEGRAEGKAEEKRAIARNMKAIGLTLEQIKTATGLTENEIEAL
ncbi:MAG: PD-(D/E)XK nuclease family transposase [Candidatus Paraprevotella stercoravium]|uniref:PD-(D/E)XK nuclease family transposase n=1 Tax=Candidatus Paraprevotella stercoravium TaxID=2838725 RepID=A0A9E2L5V5_9BACT|nr:PD-(D/E)XK nuclease family transposase [Candidatus Paraprevotella stercoravium]